MRRDPSLISFLYGCVKNTDKQVKKQIYEGRKGGERIHVSSALISFFNHNHLFKKEHMLISTWAMKCLYLGDPWGSLKNGCVPFSENITS